MNNNNMNPVIITEGDYQLIKGLIGNTGKGHNEMTLSHEMNRAILVKKDALPVNTIGINSEVAVLDIETQKVKSFTIVMPAMANMSLGKISILSPMGTALIGFRKGEEVVWGMPGGLKKFLILEVKHPF